MSDSTTTDFPSDEARPTVAVDCNPEPSGTVTHDPRNAQPSPTPVGWQVGGQVGEYHLLQVLGKGAFGTVYLAHQTSLDRRVALKVTESGASDRGEGMALAGLEHDHIVKVFAGFLDEDSGRYCLCLQYVPGADLAAVIRELHSDGGPPPTTGRDVLSAVDRRSRGESRFDPGALRDREELAADDFPQAVCRLGAKLARALAFAHARDVLHCDVKPGNILLTPYGRPMLADFNVAFDRTHRGDDDRYGGTVSYMAPEHLAAVFHRSGFGPVDARSDIYSLGMVLHQLATGELPAGHEPMNVEPLPRELVAVIRRCLERDASRRYQSASELADALDAARALLAARRRMPPMDRPARWIAGRPFRALLILAFAPHVVASALNIAYNAVFIELSAQQTRAFHGAVLVYNLLVYPACVAAWLLILRRAYRLWVKLPSSDGPTVDELRQRSLTLGLPAVGLAAIGWLPGAVVFPLSIHWIAGPLSGEYFAHFAVSLTLSGLVGMVFSYLGVQAVVLRALYPASGNPDRYTPALADAEVQRATRLFPLFMVLASAVPLSGAVLLIVLGSMNVEQRLLAAGLIGLGMAGVSVAARVTDRLNRLAAVWLRGPEASP